MTDKTPTDQARTYFDEVFSKFPVPPSGIMLGVANFELDENAKSLTVDFLATPEMLNSGGSIQGGFLTAMLDDVMGPLTLIMTAGEFIATSVDLHTQFHRPAKPGKIRGVARLTKQGANLVFSSAELYNPEGKIIASAIQTGMVFPFDPSSSFIV